MQGKRLNLAGNVFGRLTVLSENRQPQGRQGTFWNVQCVCGAKKIIAGQVLMRPRGPRSCGCLAREISSAINTVHGMEKTRTYKSWSSMKERCSNHNNSSYHNYGGRGITVCEEWHLFENFLSDMGERPEGMTLDRKENNGNYEPSNCRWATPKEQSRNRRTLKLSLEKATTIRSLFGNGMRKYLIAKEVGVTFSNVKDVIANRCWVE